jgi:hypothetical protein
LPGAIALGLIPILVRCEVLNRKARLAEVPHHKTVFVARFLHMAVEKAVLYWRRRRATEAENRMVPGHRVHVS